MDILKVKVGNQWVGIPAITGYGDHVHIKYAASQPAQDSDMKTTPDAWMGIYAGSSQTAPAHYTSYTWYKIKGDSAEAEDITQAVDDWLDEHPDATTTVEDGSITLAKLHSDLKDYIDDEEYVTPERFGAVGDDTADDTSAINQCIAYAISHSMPIRALNKYKVTSPIQITGEYLDVYINYLRYTGSSSAALIFSSRYSRLVFNYINSNGIGLLLTDDSNVSYSSQTNLIYGNTIRSAGDCIRTYGTNLPVYYNKFDVKYCYTNGGNCISSNTLSAENTFIGTRCHAPTGWAVYRARGRYYSLSMEDDVLNGIYLAGTGVSGDNDNGIFIGCRHAELQQKLRERILGITPSATGGTVIKIVGMPTIKYVSEQYIYYQAIDLTEAYKAADVDTDTKAVMASKLSVIDAPIRPVGRHCMYGQKMYFIGGYRVCDPMYESVYTVTDADFDMRDSQQETNILFPYPTRFVIGVADCEIHLASSYCSAGYNTIIVDQSDATKLCTIYDSRDSTTPIFNGSTLGAGVYELKCLCDVSNSNSMYNIMTNDTWVVRKLIEASSANGVSF